MVSGEAGSLPSILGIQDPEEAAARAHRVARRRKRRAEIAEKEVEEIMKRLDDTGETADEIFYETKPEAEAFNADDKDHETKGKLLFIRQSWPENNEC